MADGKITLEVDAEIKQAEKNLHTIGKEIEKTGKKLDSLQTKLNKIRDVRTAKDENSITTKSIEKITKELEKQEQKIKQLKVDYAQAAKAARQMLIDNPNFKKMYALQNNPKATSGVIAANAKKWGINLEEYAKYLDYVKTATFAENQFNEAKRETLALEKDLAYLREQQASEKTPKSNEELALEEQITNIVRERTELEEDYASQTEILDNLRQQKQEEEELVKEYQKEQEILSAINTAAGILARTMGKVASFAAKIAFGLPLNAIKKKFDKLTYSVKNFGRRLKYVILQGLLFRNLRKYLSEFASSIGDALKKNTEFSASLANLKGAFWSAIAPVVDAIAPILAKFMNLLANLISYLSALISLLFGIGRASSEAGAALVDAGNDAKKASKNLASWDTIQNLESGSGSTQDSGLTPTFGQDFETAYEKLEWLKKLLEDGDWFKIGYKVGEIFNDIVDDFDNFMKKIQPKAETFAKDISDFLNGLVTSFKSYDFGKTVATAFNGIINAIDKFFTNLWSKDLGVSIGNAINGFLKNIDAKKLAVTLSNVFKSVLQFFNGLLSTLDWSGIGQKIGEFIRNIDWAGLLKDSLELIKNVISGAWWLLSGLLSGLAGEESQHLFQETDNIRKAIEQTDRAIQRNIDNREAQLRDLDNQDKLTQELITRLYELEGQSDKSNKELAEMSGIVSDLNEMYPDLNLYLDIQTGKLNLSEEAVRNQTKALLEQYKAEALKEQIIQNYKDLQKAEENLSKVDAQLQTATDKLNGSQRTYDKTLSELQKAQADLDKLHGDRSAPGYQELSDKVSRLNQELAGYGAVLKQDKTNVDTLTKVQREAQGVVNKLKQEQKGLSDSLYNTERKVYTNTDSVKKNTNAVKESSREIRQFADTATRSGNDYDKAATKIDNKTKQATGDINSGYKNAGKAVTDFGGTTDRAATTYNNATTRMVNQTSTASTSIANKFALPNGAVQQFADTATGASSQYKTVTDQITKNTDDMAQSVNTAVRGAAKGATDSINDMKTVSSTGMAEIDSNITKGTATFMTNLYNGIKSGMNALIDATDKAVTEIVKGINSISFTVPDVGQTGGGTNFRFNVSKPTLNRLATGTVVNPGHEFAAILGDNRHEQEVVSPLSTMKEALIEALSEFGSTGTPVILELDGKKIATAVVPHINNQSRAYGRSVII